MRLTTWDEELGSYIRVQEVQDADIINTLGVFEDKQESQIEEDKKNTMDKLGLVRILRNEQNCVIRNEEHGCNRMCSDCDLVMTSADIIKAYDDVIEIIYKSMWAPYNDDHKPQRSGYLAYYADGTIAVSYDDPEKSNKELIAWMDLPDSFAKQYNVGDEVFTVYDKEGNYVNIGVVISCEMDKVTVIDSSGRISEDISLWHKTGEHYNVLPSLFQSLKQHKKGKG